jgi:hypothetical protein
MKNILIKIFLIVLFAATSIAQTDSIMFLKDTDFSIYSLHKVKYQSTGKIVMEKELVEIVDVRSLTFLSNDSLSLFKYKGAPVNTRLSLINEVNKYKYRFSPVLGCVMGAAGAVLVAGGIVWLMGSSNNSNSAWIGLIVLDKAAINTAICGALVVAAIGGYIGFEIADSINHNVLDLSDVSEKDKKAKLIKFLRQK